MTRPVPRDPDHPTPPGAPSLEDLAAGATAVDLAGRIRAEAEAVMRAQLAGLGLDVAAIEAQLLAPRTGGRVAARYCWRCHRPILRAAWVARTAGAHAVLLEGPGTIETLPDDGAHRLRVVARTDVAVVLCSAVPWRGR